MNVKPFLDFAWEDFVKTPLEALNVNVLKVKPWMKIISARMKMSAQLLMGDKKFVPMDNASTGIQVTFVSVILGLFHHKIKRNAWMPGKDFVTMLSNVEILCPISYQKWIVVVILGNHGVNQDFPVKVVPQEAPRKGENCARV